MPVSYTKASNAAYILCFASYHNPKQLYTGKQLTQVAPKLVLLFSWSVNMTVKCSQCDRNFRTDDALQQHIRDSHKPTQLPNCQICSRTFNDNDALEQHLKQSRVHKPLSQNVRTRIPTESRNASADSEAGVADQMKLLQPSPAVNEIAEIKVVPLLTEHVRKRAADLAGPASVPFTQYGLLGGIISDGWGPEAPADPRIFYNIAAPSSVFICGSQGSGKSHTLSCLLENCLIQSCANVLPRPLTGMLFHYDTFMSDNGGEPCEAAYLASNRQVKVRILCAPTNIRTIQVGQHII